MEDKKFKIGEIVQHKFDVTRKMMVMREINPSQYDVMYIDTKEVVLCMKEYLLTVQEYRDDLIDYFLE
mgnify:CR=1 FL=1